MVEIPAHLAAAAFDGLVKRGQIIHFAHTFDGETVPRNKFAVLLNWTVPDDPAYFAFTTSKLDHYNKTSAYDRDIIRVPIGTYPFFTKDTIINFRELHEVPFDELRKQYTDGRLKIVGPLLKVHEDHANRILTESLVIEGRKTRRCLPPAAKTGVLSGDRPDPTGS